MCIMKRTYVLSWVTITLQIRCGHSGRFLLYFLTDLRFLISDF